MSKELRKKAHLYNLIYFLFIGVKGKIVFSVDVDASGKVTNSKVIEKTISTPRIIALSVQAVRKCIFEPARQGLENVPGTIEVVYDIDVPKEGAPAVNTNSQQDRLRKEIQKKKGNIRQ